jgi:rare lipoprotein A
MRTTRGTPLILGLALALALALGAGCSARKALDTGEPRIAGRGEEGVASWYGRPYHGRRTASGETYDMHELTAAHPTLPFGSRVRLVNLDNGRTVVVRINDRGPFRKGRIIDVSRAAARKLGMVEAGVARVRLTRLDGG